MWVFVSCNYNAVRLTKSMVEAATKKKSDLTDLNMLQETLVEELRGKRFLLILDDVWNEVRANWDRTRLPLNAGRSRSKVVITTRIKRVAQIMGTVPPYHLKRLSKDASWTLFRRSAFAGGEFAGNHKLQAIGKEIVSKLDGIPLAAKTIGSMLFARRDEVDWRKILKSEFWELPANENDILPPLKLSYQTLPSHLKQCFSYCSIFQKGYEFDKDKLVKIWMGQGFLQHQGTKQMEDTGAEYFDDAYLETERVFLGLPKGITNLINLRHLEEDSRLISSVAGIGKLTCLQELPIFKIHQQIGHRISELKDMTEIRGSLCVLNLENVADAEEARQARLSYKQHLQKLQLEWNAHSAGSFRDEDILECLQPHESLKELHIEGYNGSRFLSWPPPTSGTAALPYSPRNARTGWDQASWSGVLRPW
ncbi:putative disease resistance RPP13-like protein 1 [Musa acuminata AAA Group]